MGTCFRTIQTSLGSHVEMDKWLSAHKRKHFSGPSKNLSQVQTQNIFFIFIFFYLFYLILFFTTITVVSLHFILDRGAYEIFAVTSHLHYIRDKSYI